MAKRNLTNKKKNKKGIGKVMGRSQGPSVWNEKLGRRTSPKMNAAIQNNERKE